MVINMRFYLLTVIFIFLALGIGIFIGFMFDAQGILKAEKEDLISKLEERFSALEEEKEKIKESMNLIIDENKDYKTFNNIIFPDLIKDKLSGVNIAILQSNDNYDYSDVIPALENAGANVSSYTILTDKFMTKDSLLTHIFSEYMNTDDKDNIIIYSTSKLVDAIISGKSKNIITKLKENDLIKIWGSYKENVDYFIIAGGSKEENKVYPKMIDCNIIESIKNKKIPIVGIEKKDVLISYTDVYKSMEISTIDNIDSIIGKVSLIYTMEGNPGNYGVKPSAESLFAYPRDKENKGEFR